MKKFLTIALVVAMMLSLAVVASAALDPSVVDSGTGVGTSNGTIQIDYVDNSTSTSAKVYYVVVTWEDTAMSYTKSGDTNVWDPENHQYKDQSTTIWTDDTATVTVFNHSNDAITATLAITNDTENNGVTLAVEGESTLNIVSAEGKAIDAPELEGEFTIKATGKPTADVTIVATVTIAPKQP